MDICTKIINQWQGSMSKTEAFVLHTVKDNGTSFVQIEALNRSHTTMFKIRVKQSDVGLIFKYPLIYEAEDAMLRKWKLRRMNFDNISDKCYWDLLKFDDTFDEEYDSFECSDLKRLLLNWDCNQIEIKNNGFHNIYSIELLRSSVIDYDLENIGLKLIHQDSPLRLNYKYGIFDVYCLIAPRVGEREEKREEIFYLRV